MLQFCNETGFYKQKILSLYMYILNWIVVVVPWLHVKHASFKHFRKCSAFLCSCMKQNWFTWHYFNKIFFLIIIIHKHKHVAKINVQQWVYNVYTRLLQTTLSWGPTQGRRGYTGTPSHQLWQRFWSQERSKYNFPIQTRSSVDTASVACQFECSASAIMSIMIIINTFCCSYCIDQ